jgi:hypothetical protein
VVPTCSSSVYAGLKIKPYELHAKFPTDAEALQVI